MKERKKVINKKDKEKDKFRMFMDLVIIALFLIFIYGLTIGKEKCYMYNPSNSTGSFADEPIPLFGRCYVKMTVAYEKREECGLFGISCYERSEPTVGLYSYTYCYRAKNGEPC